MQLNRASHIGTREQKYKTFKTMLVGKCIPNSGQYISKNHEVNGGMHEKIQTLVLLIFLLLLQNDIK